MRQLPPCRAGRPTVVAPMGINPTLLVVPPTLRETALELVKAERNAAGATNVNRNAVEVLVTPYLT